MQYRVYFAVASLILLSWTGVHADSVTVGCVGAVGGPFDYTTISDALTALHAISFRDHVVTISGNCSEYVDVYDFENLRLEGLAGAVILDPGTLVQPTLNIRRSEGIQIADLTVRGAGKPSDLVQVSTGSEVEFWNCVIEGGGRGMFIRDLSKVHLFASSIQDNDGFGVRVDANSLFQLGSVEDDTVPVQIQRNKGVGVIANDGATVRVFGATTIHDNQSAGLLLNQATSLFCCEDEVRHVERNSSTGIVAFQSNVRFVGPARIAENHNSGIFLDRGSAAFVGGRVTIIDNGAYGILALRNSEVSLSGTTITGNGSQGLFLQANSSASVSGSTITGNRAEGIHVSYLSTLGLFARNMIEGNQGFDVYCTPDSPAGGEKTGVARMSCPGFGHNIPNPQPGTGGPPPEE